LCRRPLRLCLVQRDAWQELAIRARIIISPDTGAPGCSIVGRESHENIHIIILVPFSLSDETHEVTAKNTFRRVTKPAHGRFLQEKGMATIARILAESYSLAYLVDPMTEQPATMPNLLVKGVSESIR
jgi:hypothetical protein